MEKQKSILVILLTFVASFVLNAQVYDDYDLSKYITPDIVRNSLDFNLSSGGFFNASDDVHSISGDLNADFKRVKNTRSFIGDQKLELNTSGLYRKDDYNNQKYNNNTVKFSYYNSAAFYNHKKEFFKIGGKVSAKRDNYKYESEQNKTNRLLKEVSVSVDLGLGKGRFEDVTDARQAIYIIENLTKKNVLTRKLNDQEIFEFSQLISKVKNKRFLDARLHTMDEIEAVDSFLVNNDLLQSSRAPYFTTLYDYWMYGDRFKRESGRVTSFSLSPKYDYDKTTDYDYLRENKVVSILGTLDVTWKKPTNLYWQRTCSFNLNGLYNSSEFNDRYISESDFFTLYLSTTQEWGYYPNSRTNINFGGNAYLGWNKYSSSSSVFLNANAFVKMYYYLSPQLRIAGEASLGAYNFNEDSSSETLTHGSFNLTLTYSLF